MYRVSMKGSRSVSYTHLEVIMVGDKEHDVFGARKAGIECVAVAYGYGTEQELKQAQPLKIVDSVQGIVDFFC